MKTAVQKLLTGFVEAWIHQVIGARGIYPRHLFDNVSFYDMSILECRVGRVRTYISQNISDAVEAIMAGTLQAVAVSIEGPKPERVTLEFRALGPCGVALYGDSDRLVNIFRSFLLQTMHDLSSYAPCPDTSIFYIEVDATAHFPGNRWLPVDPTSVSRRIHSSHPVHNAMISGSDNKDSDFLEHATNDSDNSKFHEPASLHEGDRIFVHGSNIGPNCRLLLSHSKM